MTRMELIHLELLPLIPVSAEVAINFKPRARILQMLLDTLQSLNRLGAGKALNFEALAFEIDVLFKVFQVDTLLNLGLVATMENFDLPKHLV